MSWNQIIIDNQEVIEAPVVTSFIGQAIQHIKALPSVG